MNLKVILRIIYILVFACFLSTSILPQNSSTILRWKKIHNISLYRVQIKKKQTGKLVVNKVVNQNYLNLQLEHGDYLTRAAALNKFQKIIVWSQWRNLSLVQSGPPGLVSNKIQQSKDHVYLNLAGKNLGQQTKIELLGADGSIKPLKHAGVSSSKDHITVGIALNQLKPQKYHLVMVNPLTKPVRIDNVIEMNQDGQVSNIYLASSNTINSGKNRKPLLTNKLPAELNSYRNKINNMKYTCSNSTLPDILIKKCFQYHIKLDLDTLSNRNLYYFINLESDNAEDRSLAYQYFEVVCTKDFNQAFVLMDYRAKAKGRLWYNEQIKLEKALKKQKTCQ